MTWSWREVAYHLRYNDTPAGLALVGLCEYIDARVIRTSIHGWASIAGLGICQIPVWHDDAPHLWLTPAHDKVDFSYRDTTILSRQWRRSEPVERVLERFRKTMIRLNWFTDRSVLE